MVIGTWTNQQSLALYQPVSGAHYGRAVHTFGDFVIVGDSMNGGGATVYIMPDKDWQEETRLACPNDASPAASFGASVALEANIAIIGAPMLSLMGKDPSSINNTVTPAQIFVYSHNANLATTPWLPMAKFQSLQPGTDGYGYSISIGTQYIAVGAPFATSALNPGDGYGIGVTLQNGAVAPPLPPQPTSPVLNPNNAPSSAFTITSVGAVYTYALNGNTWVSTGVIVPAAGKSGDMFGWSVDISPDGSRLVVGSPGDTVDGTQSGSATVYTMTNGQWVWEATLTGSDEEPFDSFGYSVSADISDVIVGTKTARSAYIFHRLVSWVQEAKLVGSDTTLNDGFGQSVSIFGTFAAIGSPFNLGQGAVYLWEFDMDFAEWIQLQKIPSGMPNSSFGVFAAIGSRFLIGGAPSANDGTGGALTLMFDSTSNNPTPDSTGIEDVIVLIRFSGSSTSMNMLSTRRIIADAAGTSTAHVELRIVDIATTGGPASTHLFGLQIRFTSSATITAGTAAQNLLLSLDSIRYRLNAEVGAVSGAAEILPSNPPFSPPALISIEQFAAVVILIIVTIFTGLLLFYFTAKRRQKIAADKRDFEAQEAEKKEQAKREKEKEKDRKANARPKRPPTVLGKSKRRESTYIQADNDAAGLVYSMYDDEPDFLLSPREGPSLGEHETSTDKDPRPSPRPPTLEDGPSLSLDSPKTKGSEISTTISSKPSLDDGPSLLIDEDPTTLHDDGPSLSFDSPRSAPALDDGPSLSFDDGPSLKLEEIPSSLPSDPIAVTTEIEPSPRKLQFDDGPSLMLEDDPTAAVPTYTTTSSSEDSIRTSDGVPLLLESSSEIQVPMTPTKRPSGVPKLNLPTK